MLKQFLATEWGKSMEEDRDVSCVGTFGGTSSWIEMPNVSGQVDAHEWNPSELEPRRT